MNWGRFQFKARAGSVECRLTGFVGGVTDRFLEGFIVIHSDENWAHWSRFHITLVGRFLGWIQPYIRNANRIKVVLIEAMAFFDRIGVFQGQAGYFWSLAMTQADHPEHRAENDFQVN